MEIIADDPLPSPCCGRAVPAVGTAAATCHTVLQVDHLQCGPPPSGGGQTGWGTDGGHPTGTPEDVRQSKAGMHESDVRRGTFTSITFSAWTGSHASLNQPTMYRLTKTSQ